MKTHIFYLVIGLLMINTLSGQVKIGDNPQTLHPASVLELESSTRALVITRVSNIEMNSITPLAGALVYNTDEDCLHYYNGTEWINICETLDNSFTVSTLALHNVTSQDSTVVITQEDTPDGINYNFEVNKIGSDNITNFSVLNSHIAVETITNDKIQNGTITNAKLDKLSIPLSGFGTPLTDVSMGNAARLTNLQNPTAPQDAATKSYVDNLADDDITAVTFNPANNRLTVNEGTTSFFTDLSPLEESADILANTTAINNHITNDNDTDPNNENQTVSAGTGISINQVGDDFEVTNTAPDQTVSLADGGSGNVTIGGTYPNLTIDVPSLNDNDSDPNNENQTVSAGTGISVNQVGDDFEVTNTAPDQTVSLADGGSGNVTIGGTYPNLTIDVSSLNDNDSDPNNENQTVSAGTGISVNQVGDDFEVTNTAPDQTVSLADGGSGNVTIGGTYPNLTIDVPSLNDNDSDPNNENQTVSAGTGISVNQVGDDFEVTNTAPDQTVSLADGGNGNVTIGGTYPNLTIDVPDDTNTLYTAGIGLTATGGGTIFNVDNLAGDVTGPTSATVIADGVITSAKILDGTITNADINSGAAIDGSKISPVFTTDVTTTGDFIDLTPDFVFEKYFNGFSNLNNEYRFRTLEEVEAFVKENNHLPGIRSAYEIKESGQYRLTESSLAHLEKIEELFLHTIEQEKKIEQLQADNQKLSSELDSLKADMEKIKALLSTKTLD